MFDGRGEDEHGSSADNEDETKDDETHTVDDRCSYQPLVHHLLILGPPQYQAERSRLDRASPKVVHFVSSGTPNLNSLKGYCKWSSERG